MAHLAVNGGRPVRMRPFAPWPVAGVAEEKALLRVVRSGLWTRTSGQEVARFEKQFAAYHDASFGVAVANGTLSLMLALQAAGIKEGDEVIVPPYSFLATASAVVSVNATPIFVDIDPETYNIDVARIEGAVTKRTRAIMPVHVGGLPADMDGIMRIARKHGLIVIEDAAHAHGGAYKGRKLGSIGHFGTFSFQACKNLTGGEGGMVLVSDPALHEAALSIHNFGRRTGGAWHEHLTLGHNYRMTEFQGALLCEQLKRLDRQTERRDANSRYLDRELARIDGIRPRRRDRAATRVANHMYIMRYDKHAFADAPKARFIEALVAEGIPAFGGYPMPINHQPIFRNKAFGPYTGYRRARPNIDFAAFPVPVCERVCREESVMLLHDALLGTTKDMESIVAAVRKISRHRDELAQ